MNLRVGSLFSGIGGTDLALSRVFPESAVIWKCDKSKEVNTFLKARSSPHLPIYQDVRHVGFDYPSVDIITASFPCQPVSTSGMRLGEQDSRWLWPHTLRVISLLSPRAVVCENVKGIKKYVPGIIKDLEEQDYRVVDGFFTAKEVGMPHIRKRWFAFAWKKGFFDYFQPKIANLSYCDTPNMYLPILPTPMKQTEPQSTELRGKQNPHRGSRSLKDIAKMDLWKEYRDCMEFWAEIIKRPPPQTRYKNSRGNPDVNPRLVEWMMGFRDGYVTGVNLSPKRQRWLIGNAVAPRQGGYAIWNLVRDARLREEALSRLGI